MDKNMRRHLDIGNKPACGAWSSSMYGGKTVITVKGKEFVDCNSCKRTNAYKMSKANIEELRNYNLENRNE